MIEKMTSTSSSSSSRVMMMSIHNNDDEMASSSSSTRRQWMKTAAAAAATTLGTVLPLPAAQASVYVDPDRYGDKELKIATVNKIRQNVRNAINASPALAPLLVKLAIQDALTYDAATQEGGPDGSIVRVILEAGRDNPSLSPLQPAAAKLSEIAKNIKRTTEITMADVVTFAGAEAIESVGGPRVVVQLGKTDPKADSKTTKKITAQDVPDLFGRGEAKQVVRAFQKSGLTEREIALLYGAVGSMEKVATNAVNVKQAIVEEEVEANEMGDVEIFIPNSFGAPKDIYGKQLGVMDSSVFTAVINDTKAKKKPAAGDVFTDEKVYQWATKYAGSKGGFLKDLPEAYTKLMALGTRYTGGRIGGLLGQEDPTF